MSCIEHVLIDTEIGNQHAMLTEEEKEKLFKEAESLGKDFCRRCGYCLSKCPEDIKIPDIFRFYQYLAKYYTGEWARQQYALLEKKASDCSQCGLCEKACPYGLPIRKMLKESHQDLRFKKTVFIRTQLINLLRRYRLYEPAFKIKNLLTRLSK